MNIRVDPFSKTNEGKILIFTFYSLIIFVDVLVFLISLFYPVLMPACAGVVIALLIIGILGSFLIFDFDHNGD